MARNPRSGSPNRGPLFYIVPRKHSQQPRFIQDARGRITCDGSAMHQMLTRGPRAQCTDGDGSAMTSGSMHSSRMKSIESKADEAFPRPSTRGCGSQIRAPNVHKGAAGRYSRLCISRVEPSPGDPIQPTTRRPFFRERMICNAPGCKDTWRFWHMVDMRIPEITLSVELCRSKRWCSGRESSRTRCGSGTRSRLSRPSSTLLDSSG